MKNYRWANPIRTGMSDGPTMAERTITPDPAAVERLKRLMAEQAAERERRQQAAAESAAQVAAALRARREQQAASKAEPPQPKPQPAPRRPAPRWKKVNDAQARQLHERYIGGEQVADLAAEVGITANYLRRIFRNLNLPTRPRTRRPRHAPRPREYPVKIGRAEAEALHARRMNGEGAAAVAAAAGVTVAALRRSFERYDLPIPPPVRNDRPRRVTDDKLRELHARYVAGESSSTLAAEIGIHRHVLTDRFRRAGLTSQGHTTRPRLTAEQLDAVVAAHDAGQPWHKLAADWGMPRTTIRSHVSRHKASRGGNNAERP